MTNHRFPKVGTVGPVGLVGTVGTVGMVGTVGTVGTVGLVGSAESLGVLNFSCATKAMCFSCYIKESYVVFKTQLFSTHYWVHIPFSAASVQPHSYTFLFQLF